MGPTVIQVVISGELEGAAGAGCVCVWGGGESIGGVKGRTEVVGRAQEQ